MTNNTWQITPIGEQIELLTDYTANGSFAGLKQNVQYYNQSNYAALVRTTDLEKKVFAPERFTDKKGYDFLKKSSLTGGEIVLANVGSIGKVYRVPQYHLPMTLAPNMYLIRFKESIDKNYAFQYLTSQIFQKKLLSNVASTTLSAINKSNLRSITIPVPPLEVQHRIGDILSSIDEAIQKTDQILTNVKLLNKGIIFQLLDESATQTVKLNTVCTKITDGTHRTPKYITEGIPFLRINDIQDDQINWNKCKYISEDEHNELIRRCNPEKGDVLLSKNGTIGITKVVDWDREFSIFVSLCLIKPNRSKVLPEYLAEVVGSDYVMDQVKKRSKQGTVTNLHLEEIRDFDIPLPDINRQNEVISVIKDLKAKEIKEETTYNAFVKLKSGLMHDIFNQKVQIN
jgi:type I restriction enzyme S subunit